MTYVLAMRRTLGSLFAWLGGAVFIGVMAVLVGSIVNTMRNVQPVHAKPRPVTAVAWGGRVYWTSGALARRLRARGIDYSTWAHHHRSADRVLKRQRTP